MDIKIPIQKAQKYIEMYKIKKNTYQVEKAYIDGYKQAILDNEKITDTCNKSEICHICGGIAGQHTPDCTCFDPGIQRLF